MRDLRLLLPAAVAWSAAWWAVWAPDPWLGARAMSWALWASGLAVLALMVGTVVRRGGPRRADAIDRSTVIAARLVRNGPAVVVALAAAALVTSSAASGLEQRAQSPLTAAAHAGQTVHVVVDVVAAPRLMRGAGWGETPEERSVRVDGRLVSVDGADVAAVAVTTTLPGRSGRIELGGRVAFDARSSTLPAEEESGFRLRAGGEVRVEPPPPWLAWAAVLRHGFADAAAGLGGDGGALVPGLAIGDTTAVDAELDAAMKASSLSHLTAVSGANCAIVTAAAFGLAALLRLPRAARVVVAMAALVGFVALVTPQPSVVRAGVMAIVVLIAIAAGRPGGGVAALSVAVSGLLVADPWFSRDYGFALSAAATAGLLLLAGPLSARMARVMPVPLAIALGVPLAAQLACQPVLVLLDPAIAVYGVAANLLAAPAAPVGTVIGMLGCLVLPVLPSVGTAFLQLAWLPASWIAVVAHGAAALPGGRLPWLPDAPGALLLGAGTALALWLVLGDQRRRAARAVAAFALAIVVAVPVGSSLVAPVIGSATRPPEWDVASCDVGQGDAVLIRSAGETALVDTGPDPAALDQCLALLGVERVDLLVLTHWDADHVGGAAAIAGRVEVVVHGPLDGARSDRALGPLVRSGAEVVEVLAGHGGLVGDAYWRVLWPRPGLAPGNDASVVLEVDAADYRMLLLGDLGEEAQARLLRSTEVQRADLVKVAHHGSADQSARLYHQVGAAVGIIGVGRDNGYGHPTERLLDLLRSSGTTALRTDRSGTAVLTAEGDGVFRLWSERSGTEVGPRP
ncbi:ComEC/Rec2 family competence protein [Agromyces sp. Marseille-P2726]|uniref:ComEC/Rec2 family competence protein n=1 Tax=Agromyces sp. Marseille-P2726 TaxID=2709132 RepID=UPI001570DE7D|nr:ComEC/Rec2 family competence protein [Agromyces sp. Marseille-P2726]